jgi:hypothetical protein
MTRDTHTDPALVLGRRAPPLCYTRRGDAKAATVEVENPRMFLAVGLAASLTLFVAAFSLLAAAPV